MKIDQNCTCWVADTPSDPMPVRQRHRSYAVRNNAEEPGGLMTRDRAAFQLRFQADHFYLMENQEMKIENDKNR